MGFRDEIPAVKRRIEEAFADVAYPGDDHIAPHSCLECEEISEFYKGKTWKDIPAAEAHERPSADLGLMRPAAFRRFLPAFLLASLIPAEWNEGLTTQADATLGKTMPALENMATYENSKGLTPTQFAAIAEFLRLVDEYLYQSEELSSVRAYFESKGETDSPRP